MARTTIKRRNTLTVRSFFSVWTLYGATFAGAVGSLILIGGTATLAAFDLLRSFVPQVNAVFQENGILSGFERAVSNGLESLVVSFVMLFLVWILLALCALVPATIVGVVYEVLNKYLRSEKVVLLVTYGLAGLFATVYGIFAMGWQLDGIPFLYVPLGFVTGLIACNITLRFRRDVVEPKQGSFAATA